MYRCTDRRLAVWRMTGGDVRTGGRTFERLTRGDVSTIDGVRMTGGDVSVSCWREPPSLTVTYLVLCFCFLHPFSKGVLGFQYFFFIFLIFLMLEEKTF